MRQFDYNTILDIILHLRYTAREGGETLRSGAVDNLKAKISEAQAAGSVRLFSVRHEFPAEWAKFKKPDNIETKITLEIREEHFPYWSKGRLDAIKIIDIFARNDKNSKEIITPKFAGSGELSTYDPDGSKRTDPTEALTNIPLPKPPKRFTLKIILDFDNNSMEDLWLALTWGK